jgi:hypothetical protein
MSAKPMPTGSSPTAAGRRQQPDRRGSSPAEQQRAGRQFDDHRRHHHPRRQPPVRSGVSREAVTVNAVEERVVDDLHEPDHAGHEQRRGEMCEQY